MNKLFLSYARGDDEVFVKCLYEDLTAEGFEVWWDRVSMPSRALTFLQEIRDAIHGADRIVVVIGPKAVTSDYVRAEWQHALVEDKVVAPILRLGSHDLLPAELRDLHCPDFRASRAEDEAMAELTRILRDPIPPLGGLYGEAPTPTPHFHPRPDDMTRLAGSLLIHLREPATVRDAERVLILHGMGGAGKSVLATAFARATTTRRAFPDGVFWISASEGADPLRLVRRMGEFLGDELRSHPDLTTCVTRLREKLSGKQCLIVLDNVWRVEQIEPLLETIGPNGRILATTRDAGLVTAVGARTQHLEVLSEEAALRLLADWTGQTVDILPAEALEVARECGFLPFALALNGAMVRDGHGWSDLLAALRRAELEYAEKRFINYPYPNILKSIKVSIDALAMADQDGALRFAELATFVWEAGVSEAAIETLWRHQGGFEDHHTRKLLATLEGKSLLRLEGAAPRRRVMLHDLQIDYLKATLDNPKELNESLLQAYRVICRGDWTLGPNDGYFFQHLAHHLVQAGLEDELFALLTASPEWMEAKFRALLSDQSFVNDLELSTRRASDPLALVRLHTVRLVINDRASLCTDTDLKTLVWMDRRDEALGYARLREDAKKKFDSIMIVHNELRAKGQTEPSEPSEPSLLNEALELARTIEDKSAVGAVVNALAQLGRLDEAESFVRSIEGGRQDSGWYNLVIPLAEAGRMENAIRAAGEIKDEWSRARVLRKLAEFCLTPGKETYADLVFDEAEKAAQASTKEQDQAGALAVLTKPLALFGRYERALQIADSLEAGWRRVQALMYIAGALEVAGVDGASSVFDKARRVKEEIQDPEELTEAEAVSAMALTDIGCFDKAKAAAMAIRDTKRRATQLRGLASALLRKQLFEKAGEVAHSIEDEVERNMALTELALALGLAGRLDEGLEKAREIQNEAGRAIALRELAVALDKAGDERASSIFDMAVESVRAPQSSQVLNWAFEMAAVMSGFLRSESIPAAAHPMGKLALSMVRLGRYDRARKEIDAILNPDERANALKEMSLELARLGASRARHLFDEVRGLVRVTQDQPSWDMALSKLALALAKAEHFSEARVMANAIQNHWTADDARQELARALVPAGRPEEAIEVARSIGAEYRRVEALSELGVSLSEAKDGITEALFDEAKELAFTVMTELDRSVALASLAKGLAEAGRFDKLSNLFADPRIELKVAPGAVMSTRVLRRVATGGRDFERTLVSAMVRAGLIDEAWCRAHEIHEPEARAGALASLTGALALSADERTVEALADAQEAAMTIQEENGREEALLFLGEELVRAGRFKEAKGVAFEMRENGERIVLLCSLVAALTRVGWLAEAKEIIFSARNDNSQDHQDDLLYALVMELNRMGYYTEALEMACGINSEKRRVDAMGKLAAALSRVGDQRAHAVFSEAEEVAHAIRDVGHRADAQNHLAAALAQSGRFHNALTMLGPQTIDAFAQTLADWSDYFEKVKPGLFLQILREVTEVSGWVYPNWRKRHESLCSFDLNPFQRLEGCDGI
jgi:tetratricopeptide (TPR) repeat protein